MTETGLSSGRIAGDAPAAVPPSELTEDEFLGGRLNILQPAKGYRAGIDAVLLASSIDLCSRPSATVLDCGAGVGTVGLCVAARCPEAQVILVERQAALVEIARSNIERNGLANRVAICPGDVTVPAAHAGAPDLAFESFDHVLANPPFHDEANATAAREPSKQMSHTMPAGALEGWVRFAARMTKPAGRFTLIHTASALPELLAAVRARFGALTVTGIHPYANRPAIRVIVSGIKGSRAPVEIRPPLVLHNEDGTFTTHVSSILREGKDLEHICGARRK